MQREVHLERTAQVSCQQSVRERPSQTFGGSPIKSKLMRGATMKGYIYISGTGTDPSAHKNMNDPILFSKTPTLGGCMPNIRRVVLPGDFIFVVSGMVSAIQQYVVGGMKVAEQ